MAAPGGEDVHVGGPLARVLEQGGLAHARFAAQNEGAAARGSRRVQ
jgi:hypothetical protein